MYSGDESYGDEITSPTFRPNVFRSFVREDEKPTSTERNPTMTAEPTPTTIDQLDQFAAQYTQLRKDAEAAGLEWRTVVAKADRTSKPKASTAIAGQRYTLSITMPDGTVVEATQRHPYKFCIAVYDKGAWKPKYYNLKEADAQSSAKAAERGGAEKVAIVLVTVNGQAPATSQSAPAPAAQVTARDADVIAKLDKGFARMATEELPEVVESLAAANAIAAQLSDPYEYLTNQADEMSEELSDPDAHFAELEQAEAERLDQLEVERELAEEITREIVEEEETYQNVKAVGSAAVHAPGKAEGMTRCGKSGEFIQTDAEVTCKSCRRLLTA